MDKADLENRFAFHPASEKARQDAHSGVRQQCLQLAHFLNFQLPESREKSLAVTHLEETMMWANAAIARNFDG